MIKPITPGDTDAIFALAKKLECLTRMNLSLPRQL